MSLFKTWEEHHKKKMLPPEWPIWEDCRTWAITNQYKSEYGYKGEFSPQGCLKAMPGYVQPDEHEKTIAQKAEDAKKQLLSGEKTLKQARVEFGLDPIERLDQKVTTKEESPQKGGPQNASKKTNTRSRSGNSV